MDGEVTQLLAAWRGGDAKARDALVGTLYPELRRLAGQMFSHERADHTLQPTALISEAWLRLGGGAIGNSQDHRHLLALLARSMRQILIDHARARAAIKRDGGRRMELTGLDLAADAADIDLVALDAALERLEHIDPLKARIVELRYFAGMSIEATADAVSLSPATVKRHWQAARIWLYDALAGHEGGPG